MAQIYSSNLIGVKDSVVDEFLLLSHYMIPLLSILGFGPEVGNTTHEWFEDEMFAKSDVVNNSAVVLVGATTFTVVDGSKFRVGHVVQPAGSDELMLITGISTNVLTVTRGYQGTTAAQFADSIVLHIEWIDGAEGNTARAARYKARTSVTNYTQILDETVEISGTAEAVLQYGIDSEYEKEKQKKLEELAWQLENALINGKKYSSGTNKKMGGIRNFITTNVTNGSSADITMAMVNSMVQDVVDTGGMKTGGRYAFMGHPTQKRMIGKLFDDDVVVPHQDTTRGLTVDALRTDNGTYPIIVNDNLRNNELMFIDLNRISVKALRTRNWAHTFMGKTGDKTTGMIVGEFTLQFEQEKAHSRLYGLDTA